MAADEASSLPPFSPYRNPNPSPNSTTTAVVAENPSSASAKPSRPPPKRFVKSQIPASILSDPALAAAISVLPSNYDFEVHKTLHRVQSAAARRVALQLPDGLLMYSLTLSDILRSFSDATEEVLVLGDPTYGACCLDDLAAAALGADLLVHYGHSCLVPVPQARVPSLYVFVDIRVDPVRLVDAIRRSFAKSSRLALAGTVQFVAAVHAARGLLSADGYDVIVPQAKPLSPGEVLGCTAPAIPKAKGVEAVVFVADGRFHLEAFMIANPGIRAFRYDPFLGVLVLEEYDHEGMKRARKDAILAAREARRWGVILGTLGRQGNTKVLDRVVDHMEEKGREYTVVLMSEITPARIKLFGDSVDAWVQIACPRLSIDWGEGFVKPLLTTFEFDIALGYVPGWWEKRRTAASKDSCERAGKKEESCSGSGGCESCSGGSGCSCNCDAGAGVDYPMDYYAQDGGDWNSTYVKKKSPGIETKPRSSMDTNNYPRIQPPSDRTAMLAKEFDEGIMEEDTRIKDHVMRKVDLAFELLDKGYRITTETVIDAIVRNVSKPWVTFARNFISTIHPKTISELMHFFEAEDKRRFYTETVPPCQHLRSPQGSPDTDHVN